MLHRQYVLFNRPDNHMLSRKFSWIELPERSVVIKSRFASGSQFRILEIRIFDNNTVKSTGRNALLLSKLSLLTVYEVYLGFLNELWSILCKVPASRFCGEAKASAEIQNIVMVPTRLKFYKKRFMLGLSPCIYLYHVKYFIFRKHTAPTTACI